MIYGEGQINAGANCRIASFGFRRVELAALKGATLEIGNSVFVNQGSRIIARQKIVIGDYCKIAPDVVILDSDYHSVGSMSDKTSRVTIGPHTWISTRAIILKGVTIGEGAVIAAGAVVTKDVPAQTLAAGIPARVIRKLE